jgi:hypothetical protein
MLIESFAPNPDAAEIHTIEIAASHEAVYRTLWSADLGGSPVIKALLVLRSLPVMILHPKRRPQPSRKVTLHALLETGFGRLAEEPGREIVLGITGRFWRPVGNILPFNQEHFQGSVPPGLARAVWNFLVQEVSPERTLLSTETRIVCGDTASRRKFRVYWALIKPFSGLIRRSMLRAVRRACEGTRIKRSANRVKS